ncbi:MAG: Anthranilate phosphoribosyltransferase [Candidatus Woesebacteria bacterium GW2011_GWB1_39_12]|uniref:Anthranilate phosphoribosyltransferase n=2 Tax=Candidatus Woeseibacteriota TaxID=1752722 RepID=A0A0G0LZV4_9BACT|nr:MAG: Anthranilate phosphoribosyltransferase [Candidatus Woesebacteria bacterium GW2011_GWA1_39_12]KKR00894.1 MAG: Anthranilate phosphoribosyltransferase [Candidatus Woesebacteria bacterium GW2011_GWB1_39_12]
MYRNVKNSLSKLDKIVPLMAKVVDGNNLTAKESEKVFTDIFLYDKEAYHLTAVSAGIHAKGETPDELLGFCKAHLKLGTKLKPKVSARKTTDLSGSGGAFLKTFNVSTTASFIVAAVGYTVAKQAFWGVTSPTGSADIFSAFGVNILKLSAKKVENTLENVGICPLHIAPISPRLKNRGKISRKMFIEKGIRIKSPFHLVSNATSPVPMMYRVYGIYSEKYLETLAELFFKLGYKKTLTFHGVDGLPEISNVGRTIIVEQIGDKFNRYTVTPSDLGIKKATIDEIKTGGREQNIIDFLKILMGKEKGPKADLTAVNAAASLYVMGETKSIAEAVPKAQEIIKSGEGFKVLEKLVNYQGNPKLLKEWLNKI